MTDIEPAHILDNLKSKPSSEVFPLFAHAANAPITAWPDLLREVEIRTPSEHAIRNYPDGQAQFDAVKSFLALIEGRVSELAANRTIAEEVVQRLRFIIGRYPYLDQDGTITKLVSGIICETPAVQQGLFTVSGMPLPRGAEILTNYLNSNNFKLESGRDVLNAIRSMLLKIRGVNATIVGYPGWEDELKDIFVALFRKYNRLPAKDKLAAVFNKELGELQKVVPFLIPIIDTAKNEAKNPPTTPIQAPVTAPLPPTSAPLPAPTPDAAVPPVAAPVPDSLSTDSPSTADDNDATNPDPDLESAVDRLLDTLKNLSTPSAQPDDPLSNAGGDLDGDPVPSAPPVQPDPVEVQRQAMEAQVNEYLDDKGKQLLITQILGPLSTEDREVLGRALHAYINSGRELYMLHPQLLANLLKDELRSGNGVSITDDELQHKLYEHDKTVVVDREVERLLETHNIYENMHPGAIPELQPGEIEVLKGYFFADALKSEAQDKKCIDIVGMYGDINKYIASEWPHVTLIEKSCIQGICIEGLIDGKKLEDMYLDIPTELARRLRPMYAKEKAVQYFQDRQNLLTTLDPQKKEYLIGVALAKGMQGAPLSIDMGLLSALQDGQNLIYAPIGIVHAIGEVEKALRVNQQEVPQDQYERAYLKALLLDEARRKREKSIRQVNSANLGFTHAEFMNILGDAKKISAVEHAQQQKEEIFKKYVDEMRSDVLPYLFDPEMRDLRKKLCILVDRAVEDNQTQSVDRSKIRQAFEAQSSHIRELMFECKYTRDTDKEMQIYEMQRSKDGKQPLDSSQSRVIKNAVIEFKKKRKAYRIEELAQAA